MAPRRLGFRSATARGRRDDRRVARRDAALAAAVPAAARTDRSDAAARTSSAPRKESRTYGASSSMTSTRCRRSISRVEASPSTRRWCSSAPTEAGTGAARCEGRPCSALSPGDSARRSSGSRRTSAGTGSRRTSSCSRPGCSSGALTPEEAPYVVARALGGRIELERYRGRTSYDAPAQAGERVVRSTAGLDGLDDLTLVAQENGRTRFRAWDGREWEAESSATESPSVPASCGDDPAPQRAFAARIVGSSG